MKEAHVGFQELDVTNDLCAKCEDFPHIHLHVNDMDLRGDVESGLRKEALYSLISINTRPFPERIDALTQSGFNTFTREKIDAVFVICENISTSNFSKEPNFDCSCERIMEREVISILEETPANRVWIQNCLHHFSSAYGLPLNGDIIHDARAILNYLYTDISSWEADSFPLDCMSYLRNRYSWTFSSNVWSLREQLRREALIIKKSWHTLFEMAHEQPLLLIINESAPRDYFTAFLPEGAAIFSETNSDPKTSILIYKGVKISSSEHRVSLDDTSEGQLLINAINLAKALNRRPVLCDFSRRRFPRSFLRAARFALEKKIGIVPMGKLLDHAAGTLPKAKSAKGFPFVMGEDTLTLFDPWPISDPEIVNKLSNQEKKKYCHAPWTKPWQDDRIGARVEIELNQHGVYQVTSTPWIVPAMGEGWMKVDTLFKSRIGRFIDN